MLWDSRQHTDRDLGFDHRMSGADMSRAPLPALFVVWPALRQRGRILRGPDSYVPDIGGRALAFPPSRIRTRLPKHSRVRPRPYGPRELECFRGDHAPGRPARLAHFEPTFPPLETSAIWRMQIPEEKHDHCFHERYRDLSSTKASCVCQFIRRKLTPSLPCGRTTMVRLHFQRSLCPRCR